MDITLILSFVFRANERLAGLSGVAKGNRSANNVIRFTCTHAAHALGVDAAFLDQSTSRYQAIHQQALCNVRAERGNEDFSVHLREVLSMH